MMMMMTILIIIYVNELGHFLTRSGLTYPEVSSKVCHDSFCQLGNSVSLPWAIYYEAFYLHTLAANTTLRLSYPGTQNGVDQDNEQKRGKREVE